MRYMGVLVTLVSLVLLTKTATANVISREFADTRTEYLRVSL